MRIYIQEKANDDLHKMLKENHVNVFYPYNDIYEDAKKVDASATARLTLRKMNYALYKNPPCGRSR